MKNLLGDYSSQLFSFLGMAFGPKFIKLGIRKGDRKINDNIELFKGWGKQIITEKVEEIKHKHQKNQLEAKPQDLIEAITRNSL